MSHGAWLEPGTVSPVLEPDSVQVWRVRLDRPDEPVEAMYGRLDPDERRRADRFVFPEHRRRFIVAHAALRSILGAYLGSTPDPLPFLAGPHGKPFLGPGARLRFNLSHSGALALAAFALDREVGVDVEEMRASVDLADMAQRTFSPRECDALRAVPEHRRREGFYHVWTQKEAYLKARGDGITKGLDHFDVVADPDIGTGLLDDRHDSGAMARWQIHSLEPGSGYRGALALEGNSNRIRYYDWR